MPRHKQPPTKRTSKRDLALAELGHAEGSIGRAMSLLGGRTRSRVPTKNKSTFVARKMLEGLDLRLHAVVNLLAFGERKHVPALRDDFEEHYDHTRRPGC